MVDDLLLCFWIYILFLYATLLCHRYAVHTARSHAHTPRHAGRSLLLLGGGMMIINIIIAQFRD